MNRAIASMVTFGALLIWLAPGWITALLGI